MRRRFQSWIGRRTSTAICESGTGLRRGSDRFGPLDGGVRELQFREVFASGCMDLRIRQQEQQTDTGHVGTR